MFKVMLVLERLSETQFSFVAYLRFLEISENLGISPETTQVDRTVLVEGKVVQSRGSTTTNHH